MLCRNIFTLSLQVRILVLGVPGLTGLSVPRSVEEELRPGEDSVTVQSVKAEVKPLNRVRNVTLRNVASGFPGVSGQIARDTVVEEQGTEPESVRRERFVMGQEMNRNIATLRNVKVL